MMWPEPGCARTTVEQEPDGFTSMPLVAREIDALKDQVRELEGDHRLMEAERDNAFAERDRLAGSLHEARVTARKRDAIIARQADEISVLRRENARLTDLVKGSATRWQL